MQQLQAGLVFPGRQVGVRRQGAGKIGVGIRGLARVRRRGLHVEQETEIGIADRADPLGEPLHRRLVGRHAAQAHDAEFHQGFERFQQGAVPFQARRAVEGRRGGEAPGIPVGRRDVAEIVVAAVGIIERAQPAGMVGDGPAFGREGYLDAAVFRDCGRRYGEVRRQVPGMADLFARHRAVGAGFGRVVAQPDRVIAADPAVVPRDGDDPAVRGGLDRQMLDRPGIEVRCRRPGPARVRVRPRHGCGSLKRRHERRAPLAPFAVRVKRNRPAVKFPGRFVSLSRHIDQSGDTWDYRCDNAFAARDCRGRLPLFAAPDGAKRKSGVQGHRLTSFGIAPGPRI